MAGSLLAGCSAGNKAEDQVTERNLSPLMTAKDPASGLPNRYIVVFKRGASAKGAVSAQSAPDIARSMQSAYGGKVRRTYQHALRGMAVELSDTALQALRADDRVAYVVQEKVVSVKTVTWGKDRLNQRNLPLDQAFSSPTSGQGVHAYVIDTGIRKTHSEFTGADGNPRVGVGIDFVDDDNDPEDCNGHGTHVAGTLGGNNYGVAPSVTFHSVRVLACDGNGTNADEIAGIDWVTAQKNANPQVPVVVNMSIGGEADLAVNDAIQSSVDAGVTYVVAAGNDARFPPEFNLWNACNSSPSGAPNAITVAASDNADTRADFSNYGPCVDLFAPGVGVLSSWYASDTATETLDGTSMASPHVAGVVALYLERNPAATPAQVTAALINRSTRGLISDARESANTPNRLVYTDSLFATGDTQAPSVQISSPVANAIVAGLVSVTAAGTDNTGITAMELYVNGQLRAVDGQAPWAMVWNTIPYGNGIYDLTVKAFDDSGNVATSSVVQVQLVQETTPPVVTLTAPANGALLGAMTTLSATATDASGVTKLQFLVDGAVVGELTTSASGVYSLPWDSRSVSPGAHTVVAQATDGLGNVGSATANVTVYFDSTPPIVSLTAPAAGATVSNTVTISATVTDDYNRITGVDFMADGEVLFTDTVAPYEYSWDTRHHGNGSITLTARAADPFGNIGRSAARAVTVQNVGVASYNPTYKAPLCVAVSPSCTSAKLADGQGVAEANTPNTIDGCLDGASLPRRYHWEESIDRLFVATVDGTNLAPGKQVKVDATGYLMGDANYLDIYVAADASAPVWTYMTTLHPMGSVHNIITLSAQFTLPSGTAKYQAIRGALRAFGSAAACAPGSRNDRDDLVFAVRNDAPVVYAGPDLAVTLPNAAVLDGTVADDGSPNPPGQLTTTWSRVSGPGTVTFANAANMDTTATFSVAGTYVLQLFASDGSMGTSDTVTVTVSSGGSTGPCSGLCSSPIVFTTASYQSGNLGTAATCHETTGTANWVNCSNFTSRTFTVNGTAVNCNGQALPTTRRNGGYCFQASAGEPAWASFSTWRQ